MRGKLYKNKIAYKANEIFLCFTLYAKHLKDNCIVYQALFQTNETLYHIIE